jgi:RNA 2',3'-cyclic 3'-phosphodiesterase
MARVRRSNENTAEWCLPGLGPQRLDGLFFSIFPDPAAAVRIANIAEHFRRVYGLKGEPLLTKRFHVTIHGVGNYDGLPRSVVGKAIEAGASVTARPFDVMFDRVTSFAGSDALVLCGGDGVDGMVRFHGLLGMAMRNSGLDACQQFTPHVTLLYDGRRIEQQFIEPIRWTVREFVLVHSLRGMTKHIPLERWPLSG